MLIDNLQIGLFSKCIQDYPWEKAIAKLQDMNIGFIDLTVRPGGHIEPENAETQLPPLHEKLMKAGIAINMLTTSITDASDENTRKILGTAAKLGIKHYKIGYYVYKGFGMLAKQRGEVKKRIEELSELNGELGVRGGFHNHSNNFFGASLWDVDYVISDTNPETIGVYMDPAHAVIEGGSGGWKMGMDLISDRIIMLAVKDFRWLDRQNGCGGARRHSVEVCPFDEGNVPWLEVLQILKRISFKGTVSIHSEYRDFSRFKDLPTEEILKQTAKDIAFFKECINRVG